MKRPANLSVDMRSQLLRILGTAAEPLTVRQVFDRFGPSETTLNTVRNYLRTLAAEGELEVLELRTVATWNALERPRVVKVQGYRVDRHLFRNQPRLDQHSLEASINGS